MEDFSQEFGLRSESQEESIISDQVNEVLKTESEAGCVFLVLSLDDNFNEKDLEDNGNKFFKSGEFFLSSFESEVSVNDVTDFVLVKLENALKNSFDFVDFED